MSKFYRIFKMIEFYGVIICGLIMLAAAVFQVITCLINTG